MKRFLNIGIIQMPINKDVQTNLAYISKMVDLLMENYLKPELVVGVECGISMHEAEPIPGPSTLFLCKIAAKYGIYFLPGTLLETNKELKKDQYYNSVPVINPKGEIIDIYRKMAPWYPAEKSIPGNRYVVFEIPEKRTKVGVQICYDMNFPEISRNLTLMGSEVLVKLAADPERLFEPYRHMTSIRALENQVYFVATNGTGNSLYGHSSVSSPEGTKIWEAGREACCCTVTLDLDLVSLTRECGAFFLDQNLNLLRHINPPMPFAGNFADAPVYRNLSSPAVNALEFQRKTGAFGIGTLIKNE
ncbi:carbon-nitrogen hydrolase family protein [bacterium]|nr:carbon-nitrogen hydrolase family protein [bacterium]